ncbi:MAG: ribose 5-phosphate isomerase, partial [Actinomycetota bacterium]|nr:ribose 5-phosphate isomerase [Actinomycetota bacterium]
VARAAPPITICRSRCASHYYWSLALRLPLLLVARAALPLLGRLRCRSSVGSAAAPRLTGATGSAEYTRRVRIAIGGDHAGYPLKQHLLGVLKEWRHDVDDLGTHSEDPVDYPIYCAAVGRAVTRGDADVGIVLGGSGQGEQISANKVRGVRAALCNDLYTARMARSHNDANVLSIGARIVAAELADEIAHIFLSTPFDGGRHARRIAEIAAIETEEADR